MTADEEKQIIDEYWENLLELISDVKNPNYLTIEQIFEWTDTVLDQLSDEEEIEV